MIIFLMVIVIIAGLIITSMVKKPDYTLSTIPPMAKRESASNFDQLVIHNLVTRRTSKAYWATEIAMSNLSAFTIAQPEWATHVVIINK